MLYILCLIIILYLFSYTFKEGYLNYQELSYKGSLKNCPQIHAENLNKLLESERIVQPFGYTKYRIFDITRFRKTDKPIPIEPDFFYKY
tara:strand:- start:500 stop:766 length:267 start_codon:yes stop_codon:yes gene_type:complete